MVHVETEIEIARPRAEVAAYAANPDNAPDWYANIERVDWKSPPPPALGSQIAFVARFLGRRLAYTYEVKEIIAGERLVMSTTEGPFAMETAYTWHDAGSGRTRMILRNRGMPTGFWRVAAPLLPPAMRRANREDLRRLKAILETRSEA